MNLLYLFILFFTPIITHHYVYFQKSKKYIYIATSIRVIRNSAPLKWRVPLESNWSFPDISVTTQQQREPSVQRRPSKSTVETPQLESGSRFYTAGAPQKGTGAYYAIPQHGASHIMSSAVETPQLSFAQVRSRYREKGSFFTIGSHRQEAHESSVGMPQQAAARWPTAGARSPRGSGRRPPAGGPPT